MGFETYESGYDSPDKYKVDTKGKDLSKEWSYSELWEHLFNSPNSPLPSPITDAHKIVVVDADAIVYRVSAACERRAVVATVNGSKAEFDTKTKLKAYCENLGVDVATVVHEDVYYNEPVGNCLGTLKRTVKNIYKELDATHLVFLLGGSYNARSDLPLPVQYKGNRKGGHRPLHLKACREYLNKYYGCYKVTGIEADDFVQGLTGYLINKTDAYAVAYSQDKDYHTSMVKNRYFDLAKKVMVELDGGLGSLERTKQGVKGDGLHWVCYQAIMGDPSDGYCPKPLFNKRYGEVTYYNDVKDCKTEKDLLTKWVNVWRSLLPLTIVYEDFNGDKQRHDWLSLAELFFACLYMRHSPTDNTTFEGLLKKFGVNYKDGLGAWRGIRE